jgi:2-oxoglutarate ferredoxin oxidoreductase subunit alpha
VNYLQIVYLHPFPAERVKRAIGGAKRVIVVEHNATSQLSSLIREYLLMDVDGTILKYDGRPFSPASLAAKVKEAL